MFGIGSQELIIIFVVALIIFGPKKLPEIGRLLGQGLRELKKASRDVMDSLESNDIEQDLTLKKETLKNDTDSMGTGDS
ncbi:MAG: twin-arginine translocase TatA/TatE family subunit [Armatimonadetes bacterium]|nr:twin-arginine translocase TatA/TatE family subunit [Armatimonadota bacterium]